ncbi:hypothetical protein LDENG_00101830 [Lucifuga dentata]|nr:hypothetical protein LDENG_00101830 [Lucifuga dentata]
MVVFLHTLALSWTGAIKSTPKIDGRHRTALTMQENMTHKFNCQSDGWDPHAPPLLTWYLNGEQQNEPVPNRGRLVVTSQEESGVTKPWTNHNSTFSLRARKWDRELVCVASNPRTGESYNATVTLNVQFQPEILRVNAHYSETSGPGLSLVLFALIRSNPPATIKFVDQSGQPVANTSDFLILDSRSYPWLTNHSLRVTLSNLSGNLSLNATNSIGMVQSNLTLAEFLQSRVEVPMLGIVTGGAMAFTVLLILTLIVLCLMQKNKNKSIDEPVEILMTKKSDSANLKTEKADKSYIPRENMSLPANMQLNDLSTLQKARETAQQRSVGEKKKEEEEEEDLSHAYAARGFARYPMVGYIYKVNSTSTGSLCFKEREKITMRGLIAHLLLCTLTAFVGCGADEPKPQIKVSKLPDGIKVSCVDASLYVFTRDANFSSLNLPYADENTGEYSCGLDSRSKIFVKLRTCDNCIQLDMPSAIGMVIGNLIATAVIGVAVYLVASQSGNAALSSKNSDRQHLIPNDNSGKAPNDHYQKLLRHKVQKDTYDKLSNVR